MRNLGELRERLVAALRWRPEWWIAAGVIAAWLALLAGASMGQMNPGMSTISFWCGPATTNVMPLPAWVRPPGAARPSLAAMSELPGWSLMVMAMMVPLTLPALRHVAHNSMRYRRQRAMALYITVYVATWTLFGLVALEANDLVVRYLGIHDRTLLVLAAGAAAAWQLTRTKRRALFACGRTVPLPPTGSRADAACARFALQQAYRCIRSCWAIMLIMATVGDLALLWMSALTALVIAEELTRSGRRLTRPAAAVLALAAVAVSL
jgi:predicted metal-binding membrane protein